ncbi:MAG TPA: hypothetical protein VNO43_08740 [Candidatus Eisenbacteria bacterium]|nr:hypothetical protein [Candidatus Eisenbacteria bacterium]
MRAISNSNLLRTIGQDLEMRDIKAFVISREGDRFTVKGSYQKPPCATPITIEYTLRELQDLDAERGENREDTARSADFYTLAQMLRALGGYIDRKGGRLLRISNNEDGLGEPGFRIEYATDRGSRVTDDHSVAAIYDMCVSMYKRRGQDKSGGIFRRRA